MRRDQVRLDLLAGLDGRRREIVQAILARVHSIGVLGEDVDVEYLAGLRLAVAAAVKHTIAAAASQDDRPLSVPAPVLAQARLAARRRVPLETVLRRYSAGHAVLSDFVAEEAERCRVRPADLRRLLRSQAAETDRVLAVISATYVQEADSVRLHPERRRRAKLVRRLLDGELVDSSSLGYEFDRWHLGMITRGPDADEVPGEIANRLGADRLVVAEDEGILWAWAGKREKPTPDQVASALPGSLPSDTAIGVGEPGWGRSGWRLTHEQAEAACSVAVRRGGGIARYADVALVASAMRDELLTASLQSLYLDPLDKDRNGEVLRETLRAYLTADQNVSSAAAALGVSRNTVSNRLRTIENTIGLLRPTRSSELALALNLADMT